MVQAGAAAASHALLIVSAEQSLGLFREHAVQAAVIGSDTVTDAFNACYGGTHFLVPALVLGWLLLRHPAHYARARTALATLTGLAFTCFWLFPVAPPRLWAVNGEREIRHWLRQPVDVIVTGQPALAVALRASSGGGAALRACRVSPAGSR